MKSIKDYIRTIPNYPKEGVMFRDITTLLGDADGLHLAIDELQKLLDGVDFDVVAGAESRGFICGMPVAYNLHKPFVLIRKKGKHIDRPCMFWKIYSDPRPHTEKARHSGRPLSGVTQTTPGNRAYFWKADLFQIKKKKRKKVRAFPVKSQKKTESPVFFQKITHEQNRFFLTGRIVIPDPS